MKLAVCNKCEIERFATKAELRYYNSNSWFSYYDIKPGNDFIGLDSDDGADFTLYLHRFYKKWNNPLAYDLQLRIEYENDVPVENIPQLSFPIYFWIESDVNQERDWLFRSVDELRTELYYLTTDITEAWEEFMTPSLRETLDKLLRNEIDHQIERFQSDIDELISKYNAGELVAEV